MRRSEAALFLVGSVVNLALEMAAVLFSLCGGSVVNLALEMAAVIFSLCGGSVVNLALEMAAVIFSLCGGSVVNLALEMAAVIFSLCGGSVQKQRGLGQFHLSNCLLAMYVGAKPGGGVWEDAVCVCGGGVLLAVLVLLLLNPRWSVGRRCCVCMVGVGGGVLLAVLVLLLLNPRWSVGRRCCVCIVYVGGVGGGRGAAGCIHIITAEPKMKRGKKPCMNEGRAIIWLTQAVYRQCFVLQSLVEPCACVGGWGWGGSFTSPGYLLALCCCRTRDKAWTEAAVAAGWGRMGVCVCPPLSQCLSLRRLVQVSSSCPPQLSVFPRCARGSLSSSGCSQHADCLGFQRKRDGVGGGGGARGGLIWLLTLNLSSTPVEKTIRG